MFYERIQTKDENTYVCLKMTRQAQAEKCLEANRLQRYAERQGLEVEKPKKKAVTVADVLDFYEKSGCPDTRGRLRYNPTTNTPAAYRELPYLSTLKEGFAGKTVNELRPKNLDAYHTWRCLELQAKVGPSAGGRGQAAQFVINQRQQLLRRFWIPRANRFEDLRHRFH